MKKTPRENLLNTLRRKGFDYTPVDFKFCDSQVEAFKKRPIKSYQCFSAPQKMYTIETYGSIAYTARPRGKGNTS